MKKKCNFCVNLALIYNSVEQTLQSEQECDCCCRRRLVGHFVVHDRLALQQPHADHAHVQRHRERWRTCGQHEWRRRRRTWHCYSGNEWRALLAAQPRLARPASQQQLQSLAVVASPAASSTTSALVGVRPSTTTTAIVVNDARANSHKRRLLHHHRHGRRQHVAALAALESGRRWHVSQRQRQPAATTATRPHAESVGVADHGHVVDAAADRVRVGVRVGRLVVGQRHAALLLLRQQRQQCGWWWWWWWQHCTGRRPVVHLVSDAALSVGLQPASTCRHASSSPANAATATSSSSIADQDRRCSDEHSKQHESWRWRRCFHRPADT